MAYQGADLVGRSNELADIEIALGELAAGRPRPRAYVADPGLGKTTMLGALYAAAQDGGRPTRWLRADQPVALGEVAAGAAYSRQP